MMGDRDYRLTMAELFFRESLPIDRREAIDTTADNLIYWYECDHAQLLHAIEHVRIHHGPTATFGLCITFCYRIAEATGVPLAVIRSNTAHFAFEIVDAETETVVNPDQYASKPEMIAFRMVIAVCNSDLPFAESLFETSLDYQSNDSNVDSLLWTLTKLTSDISGDQSPEVI